MNTNTNGSRALLAALVAFACFGSAREPIVAPSGATHPQRSFVIADDHKHQYVTVQSGKEWVPPKTAKKVVGYDDKGKPIYKQVVVSPGYYKKTYVEKCNVCGKVKA